MAFCLRARARVRIAMRADVFFRPAIYDVEEKRDRERETGLPDTSRALVGRGGGGGVPLGYLSGKITARLELHMATGMRYRYVCSLRGVRGKERGGMGGTSAEWKIALVER